MLLSLPFSCFATQYISNTLTLLGYNIGLFTKSWIGVIFMLKLRWYIFSISQNIVNVSPLNFPTSFSSPIHFALQHQQHCRWINTKPTSHHVSFLFFLVCSFLSVCDLPFSSLFLSKANSTSTGQLDKLVSPGFPALTPESEEERSLPPQRVSTFRPRPYSMADSNKVSNMKPLGECVPPADPRCENTFWDTDAS